MFPRASTLTGEEVGGGGLAEVGGARAFHSWASAFAPLGSLLRVASSQPGPSPSVKVGGVMRHDGVKERVSLMDLPLSIYPLLTWKSPPVIATAVFAGPGAYPADECSQPAWGL